MPLISLGFSLFAAAVIIAMSFFLSAKFLFLLVILFCYFSCVHEKKEIFFIFLFCLVFAMRLAVHQSRFSETRQGEITYVNKAGYVIKDTFYQAYDHGFVSGDIVRVSGEEVRMNELQSRGMFDEKHYYLGMGVHHTAVVSEQELITHQDSFKEKARGWILSPVSADTRPYYAYFLLGEKSDEVKEFRADASNLSLAHLFAISGMHFHWLSLMVSGMLSFFLNEKHQRTVTTVIMGGYALLLGKNISAWRAFLMMAGKAIPHLSALSLYGWTGILMMVIEPHVIFSMSFIYSMALYLAVLLTADTKWSSLAIMFVSLMVNAYFRHEITLAGMAAGLFLSFGIAVLFMLMVVNVVFRGIFSSLVNYPLHGLFYLLELLKKVPLNFITGEIPLIILFVSIAGFYYGLYRLQYRHKKRMLYIVLGSVLLWPLFPYCHSFTRVAMIDVGQGNCFLIAMPFQSANIMIDTGGAVSKDIAVDNVIPQLKALGITKLDAVYLSHEDLDHCGALESLKENFPVRKEVWDFHEDAYRGLVLKNLNTGGYDNDNDNSLVIATSVNDLNYLFTGDISVAVEQDLIDKYPDLRTDVLAVGHHGSAGSTSVAFLETLKPRLALISVGLRNRYHHPSPEVISRLRAYGVRIYRSDENGMVVFYSRDHHTFVES